VASKFEHNRLLHLEVFSGFGILGRSAKVGARGSFISFSLCIVINK
jgi:hypothetical protein